MYVGAECGNAIATHQISPEPNNKDENSNWLLVYIVCTVQLLFVLKFQCCYIPGCLRALCALALTGIRYKISHSL